MRRLFVSLHYPATEPPYVRSEQRGLGVGLEARAHHRVVPLLEIVMLLVEQAQRGHHPGGGMDAHLHQLPEALLPYVVSDQLQLSPGVLPAEAQGPLHRWLFEQPAGLLHIQGPIGGAYPPLVGQVSQQGVVAQVHAHVGQQRQVADVHHARGIDQGAMPDCLAERDDGLSELPCVPAKLERVAHDGHGCGAVPHCSW